MKTIKNQFNNMLDRGIMPAFEYQIGSDDWLLVNLSYDDRGVTFSFDSDHNPVFFDGEIIVYNDNYYCLPYDPFFSDLDHYLQMIDQNITEGFLIPNDLYYTDF